MKITYIGPFAGVTVHEFNISCKRGEEIDVPEAVGKKLLKSPKWASVSVKTKATAKAKKEDD